MTDTPDTTPAEACVHEYTLNVQLTHAWCQKCDLVIPITEGQSVMVLIAARAAAAERERWTAIIRRRLEQIEDMPSAYDLRVKAGTLRALLADVLAAAPGNAATPPDASHSHAQPPAAPSTGERIPGASQRVTTPHRATHSDTGHQEVAPP